jgi:MIP family channel proteins
MLRLFPETEIAKADPHQPPVQDAPEPPEPEQPAPLESEQPALLEPEQPAPGSPRRAVPARGGVEAPDPVRPAPPTTVSPKVIESPVQFSTRIAMETSVRPDPSIYIPPPGLAYNRFQRYFAEFFGTFALVLFSVGAICADQFIRNTTQTGLGLLGISLAYGLTFGAMVMAVGRVSGGHLNPAITIGHWVTHRLGTMDTVMYWIAQLGGAILAAYLLRYVIPEETWRAVALGTPELAGGVTRLPGMLIEGVMTFFLVFVMFATGIDEHGIPRPAAGFAGGLIVTVASFLGAPFTGGAMNPARAIGPAVAANHWSNHAVYWIGPLAGGVIAAWVADLIFLGAPKQ